MAVDSVINMQNGVYRRRHVTNRVMLTVSLAALIFGLFWLFWIILTLVIQGRAGAVLPPVHRDHAAAGAAGRSAQRHLRQPR